MARQHGSSSQQLTRNCGAKTRPTICFRPPRRQEIAPLFVRFANDPEVVSPISLANACTIDYIISSHSIHIDAHSTGRDRMPTPAHIHGPSRRVREHRDSRI